jgi:hypothetical protein
MTKFSNFRKVRDKIYSYQDMKALKTLSNDEEELIREWRIKLIARGHLVKPSDLRKMWISIKLMISKGLESGECRMTPMLIHFYWEQFSDGFDRLQGKPLSHFAKYLDYISAYYDRMARNETLEFRMRLQDQLRSDTVRGWVEF